MTKDRIIKNERHIPYNPDITDRAKLLRKNMTVSERKLWFCYLKNCGFRFYRQKQIENYIVDFYCAKAKIIIEIDGDSHYSDYGIEYDKNRTKILESYGLQVIRFTNNDIKYRFREVCEIIDKIIEPYKSV